MGFKSSRNRYPFTFLITKVKAGGLIVSELPAPRGWDRGLDFDGERASLTVQYEVEKARFSEPGYVSRNPVFAAVLLTGLVNAARVSESLEGLVLWLKDGKRSHWVRTRKRGSRLVCECGQSWSTAYGWGKEGEKHAAETGHKLERKLIEVPREVIVPAELPDDDREVLTALLDEHVTLGAVKMYARNKRGTNTHSERYAGVSKLGDMGVPAQVGRLITQHANLEEFAGYQQQQTAHKVLKKLASSPAPSPSTASA